jgi:hypothetical protein
MSVDVRSEVVVTSGDIAQALFSKVQQDLVVQHAAIVKEQATCYKDIESFVQNWLLSRFSAIRASEEWIETLAWVSHTNALLNVDVSIEPSIDGMHPTSDDTYWFRVHQLLSVNSWQGGMRWTALKPDHVFKQSAIFVVKEDDEVLEDGEVTVFGVPSLPLGEFVDAEFCVSLNEQYKHIRVLDKESARLKALISGEKSDANGLSVHEQIQAAVTMQAVNTVPQLKAAFDIDALTVGIKQRLLPGISG